MNYFSPIEFTVVQKVEINKLIMIDDIDKMAFTFTGKAVHFIVVHLLHIVKNIRKVFDRLSEFLYPNKISDKRKVCVGTNATSKSSSA